MAHNFYVNSQFTTRYDEIHDMEHFVFFLQNCEFEVIIQSMLSIYCVLSVQIDWPVVYNV